MRNNAVKFAGIILSFSLLSCNNAPVENAENTPPATTPDTEVTIMDTLPPVETREANTSYKPAFQGQTRINGTKTSFKVNHTIVTDKLSKPWGIAQLPDGRFLVNEKGGSMRIVTANGEVSEKINNVPAVDARGQGGLLGIVLDPKFASNRMVYFSFSEKYGKGNLTAVAKAKLSNDDKSLENVTVIYRAMPDFDGTLHYGSRLLFDKEGYLFVSTGERSDKEARPLSQDKKSGLGKILRITTDGKPAPGNPYINDPSFLPEIWSWGHRNVQGIDFHPETGDLYNTEFGPRGGDELNRVVAGKNYGWPIITYGIEYSGDKIEPVLQQKEGLEQPIYYWDPVISPSGIVFYNGTAIPEWKNNLFIASLNIPHINRLVIKDGKVIAEERLLAEEKQRFRDIIVGADGYLYAVTDYGRLYKVGK